VFLLTPCPNSSSSPICELKLTPRINKSLPFAPLNNIAIPHNKFQVALCFYPLNLPSTTSTSHTQLKLSSSLMANHHTYQPLKFPFQSSIHLKIYPHIEKYLWNPMLKFQLDPIVVFEVILNMRGL